MQPNNNNKSLDLILNISPDIPIKRIVSAIKYQNKGYQSNLNSESTDSNGTKIFIPKVDNDTLAQIMALGAEIGRWGGLESDNPNAGLNVNHIHGGKINKHTKLYMFCEYEDSTVFIINEYNTMFGTNFKVTDYIICEYSYLDIVVSTFTYEDFFYLGYAIGWAWAFEDELT
jgi:hypothetical protein